MTDNLAPPPEGDRTIDEPLSEALSRRYLAYALSTITGRALPDVRDGLKPVHRRLLYAMRQLRLDPTATAKKCARVVGDVIGKYHPHGDSAVYEALVRLAQDFAQRYPLVDGQGNFGNIDGDNAAAMRYTECRLTLAAQLLLEGIDEDAVDFRATYDGEEEEPVVLPAGFPNLLANGSSGIAVGMATSIPPHNVSELIEACLRLLDQPDITTAELLEVAPGPDFPTGGVIVESPASLMEAYETGRGGVRVRARWTREDLGRGLWRIVVTEIPYQVKKADLVEQLAELIETKKAPLLGDVMDESAEDVRLVLEPKSRNVEPEVLMESLFRLSALETRIPVNMNVIDARGAPGVMGLKALLRAVLDHRREVVVRRARHRLARIESRLHILDGLIIAFLNLDEVIRIVRQEDEPKAKLIEAFDLSDLQAEAILNTRLRQLARLEEMELRREHADLAEERDGLNSLLGSDRAQWKLVGVGLRDVRDLLEKEQARLSPSQRDLELEQIMAPLERAIELTPILAELGYDEKHSFNGLLQVTTDGSPSVGESAKVRGLWYAEAVWVKDGPGIGKLVADFIEEEGVNEAMQEFVNPLADLGDKVTKLTTELGMKAFGNADEVGGAAVDYLRVCGHLVYAYFWARMAKVALAKQGSGDPFYAAKVHTARFYFAKLLPETAGLIRSARSGVAPLLAMDEAMF